LLISYPWELLSVVSLTYLVLLPLGWFSYRRYQQADAEARVTATAASDHPAASAPPARDPDDDRPARLN
jgi:CDP-diacylglycerol---serine O-phosphatidyltransferase